MGPWIARIVWIVSEVYFYHNPHPNRNPPALSARGSAATLIYCPIGVSLQFSGVLRSHGEVVCAH